MARAEIAGMLAVSLALPDATTLPVHRTATAVRLLEVRAVKASALPTGDGGGSSGSASKGRHL